MNTEAEKTTPQETKVKRSKAKKMSRGMIWIIAALLLVLVVTSIILLATVLDTWRSGEKNVITLFPGDPTNNELYEQEIRPSDQAPGIQVEGSPNNGDGSADGTSYLNKSSIDLFKDTYMDADGNVLVQSSNGNKVVAPGTSNSCEFSLKNTGNISLDYTLQLTGNFAFGEKELPIRVRLRYGDEWIVGGDNQWVAWKSLADATDTRTVPSGHRAIYYFEWMWPNEEMANGLVDEFNNALIVADKDDTSIGNAATDTSTRFDLNINTTAITTPGAIPSDRFGDQVFDKLFHRVGVTHIGVYIAIMIVVILVLFFLYMHWLMPRKKKKNEASILEVKPKIAAAQAAAAAPPPKRIYLPPPPNKKIVVYIDKQDTSRSKRPAGTVVEREIGKLETTNQVKILMDTEAGKRSVHTTHTPGTVAVPPKSAKVLPLEAAPEKENKN